MSFLLKVGFLVGSYGAYKIVGAGGEGLAAKRQASIRNLKLSVPFPQVWGGKGLGIEIFTREQ